MGDLIDDEILSTFAVVAEPEAVAPELHRRYGDVIQRISFYAPYRTDPERWARIIDALESSLNRPSGGGGSPPPPPACVTRSGRRARSSCDTSVGLSEFGGLRHTLLECVADRRSPTARRPAVRVRHLRPGLRLRPDHFPDPPPRRARSARAGRASGVARGRCAPDVAAGPHGRAARPRDRTPWCRVGRRPRSTSSTGSPRVGWISPSPVPVGAVGRSGPCTPRSGSIASTRRRSTRSAARPPLGRSSTWRDP